MAFLSVNNISKSFKEEKVLQNLSFDVGTYVAIIVAVMESLLYLD